MKKHRMVRHKACPFHFLEERDLVLFQYSLYLN